MEKEMKQVAVLTFRQFTKEVVDECINQGCMLTANSFLSCMQMVMKYVKDNDFPITDITNMWVGGFYAFLEKQRISPNTRAFYLAKIKALYNRARIKGRVLSSDDPFGRIRIRTVPTLKRALQRDMIAKLEMMQFTPREKNLEECRDMFLFSYYTRGMAPVDMARLRKSDIYNDAIYYIRSKTGKMLRVGLEVPIKKLLFKYQTSGSYALPILQEGSTNPTRQYRSYFARCDRNLHTIGKRLGLTHPLTMYVARHSWATVAKKSYVPIAVISEAMGHSSEMMTRIYLDSFETYEIDNANRIVMGLES